MKKRYWFLIFFVVFFVVFAISAVSTFLVTLDRDEKVEDATENVYMGGSVLPQGNVIEAETTVTRVTPALTVADAIILRGIIYGENANVYEKPSLTVEQDEEVLFEDAVIDEAEEEEEAPAPKSEEKKEETPKAEEKKEEVKVETPKTEDKKEVKTEEKKEEPKKEEVKVEEPKKEEAPKAEEKKEETPAPKVEEKVEEPKKEETKPQLNPDIQTSDSGL